MAGIKKVEIRFEMEDGYNSVVDISDKRYVNIQDLRQQEEIKYLNRQLDALKPKEVKK